MSRWNWACWRARVLLVLLALGWILASCVRQTPAPDAYVSLSSETVTLEQTPASAAVALAANLSDRAEQRLDPMNVPVDGLVAAIESDLPAQAFEGVMALPLDIPDDSLVLWAVYSYGRRNFELHPVPGHFVALYAHDGGWRELARLDVDALPVGVDPRDAVAPDYLTQDSVTQVQLEPGHVWLEVRGGAGAHSGTYQLLRFDGQALRIEAAAFGPSRGIGHLQDLNGDAVPEVVLDRSDPYVFCYTCGVRKVGFEVYTWDQAERQMRPVELKLTFPGEQDSQSLQAANRAIALARAGLWVDARAEMAQARALAIESGALDDLAALEWNHALIELYVSAMVEEVAQSRYPLLGNIFYGDYDAALDLMRSQSPESLFEPDSPLIAGTVAEGWEREMIGHVVDSTTRALQVEPDLAAAHFVRGWARYLDDPGDPQAQADLARATALDPKDPLFVSPDAISVGDRG